MTTTTDDPLTMQSLFHSAAHRQNLCVLAVLTWIASCDGSIAPAELDLLRAVAAEAPGGGDVLPAVIDVARQGRAEDLEIACRYLRNHFPRSQRPLLAQLFVTMAVRDGNLTVAENHVLRFLADLLALPARKFAKLFEEIAQRPFPEVGDVSSLDWWRRREAGKQASAPADGWGRDRPGAASQRSAGPWAAGSDWPAGGPFGFDGNSEPEPLSPADNGAMSRSQAMQLLAVPPGASKEEVHSAYRRMAKARHPDRFAQLGPAAQATAAAAFQLVNQAYQTLSAA
jgi:DnaJ like chaperone protein